MHARAGIIATSLIGLVALTGALAGCSGNANANSAAGETSKELTFATPPGTDDPKEQAVMKDLATMVGEASGRPVKNIQPADYLGVVEAVRSGSVDVAILSQFSAALAYKTGSVDPLLVWGASSEPASFCLARKDSGIKSAVDLKGHQIAFVDPGSTTGYFMPKALFKKAGLTDGTDYKSTFAGSTTPPSWPSPTATWTWPAPPASSTPPSWKRASSRNPRSASSPRATPSRWASPW